MKVVSPASMSRPSDVFHCLNLKNRSSVLPEPVSTASIETSSSLCRGLGGGLTARAYRTGGVCTPYLDGPFRQADD